MFHLFMQFKVPQYFSRAVPAVHELGLPKDLSPDVGWLQHVDVRVENLLTLIDKKKQSKRHLQIQFNVEYVTDLKSYDEGTRTE